MSEAFRIFGVNILAYYIIIVLKKQDTNTDFSIIFYFLLSMEAQMKILHVISDENIGGAGILLINLLSLFDRELIESSVALPANSQLKKRIEELGIQTFPLEQAVDRFSVSSVREIFECIKETKADLVHSNAAVCARIAGKLCGIPVVHTRHCCYPPSWLWHVPVIKQIGGAFNRCLSDRVIATADAAAKNLRALGIPDQKISVIINGSKPIRAANEHELLGIRESLGIEQEDFLVGICGRLEECKGHKTFLKAAKLVLERCEGRKIKFLIIGEGSLRPTLEALCKELHISHTVRFLGFVSDVAPYYRLMNINVSCSIGTETSSLAISEGMSAGLPTIASAYGGNPAMIGDGRAGFLYPTKNEHALAECILRIMSDGNLESSMRREALRRYQACYTAKRMAEEVTEVYKSILI